MLRFKASIAASLTQLNSTSDRLKKRERPSNSSCASPSPVQLKKKKTREGQNKSIPKIRYNGKNHWPKKVEMKSALRCYDDLCNSL